MPSSSQQSENPYASPRLEVKTFAEREFQTGTVADFALRASGSLTLQEGRSINRLTSVGIVRQFIVFAVLAVALLALYGFAKQDPTSIFSLDALPVIGVMVLLMGGFLVLSHLGPSWQMRRQFEQRSGIFQPQDFEFSHDSMFIKTGLVETRVKWQAFSQARRNGEFVLVYLAPPTSFFVVPRSFFQDARDWETFVALIERNVTTGVR